MRKFHLLWGESVVKYRRLIIAFTLILLGLSPLALSRLQYDNSNESYFIENDPTLLAFSRLQDTFGDTEYLMIGIEARIDDEDLFAVDTIKMIAEITDFLERHIHITQVRSLSKYQYTHDDDGVLATDDLFEYLDESYLSEQVLENAREVMANERLALDNIITRDFQHTRIIARVESISGENHHNIKLVNDVLAFIEENQYETQGFDLRLSGTPVFNERFETLTLKDQAVLMPAMGVMMMIVLLFMFRSIFTMMVPVILILSTTSFILAIQSLLNFPVSAVSSALPLIIIILSMGSSIHVLVEFYQARREGLDPKKAASKSVSDLFSAILFTSLTTSLGFIALSVTELAPLRHLAILAAVGAMIIFLISTTLLPSVLSYVPWVPKERKPKNTNKSRLSTWLAHTIPAFTYKNRKIIGGLGIVICAASLYGTQFIRVDANVLNYFKPSNWINADLHYFNNTFRGITNLEIMIDSGSEGGIKEPQFLQRAEALQNYVESLEKTGKPTSVVSFLKQINQSLNEDNPDYFRLPDSRPLAAQFLLLYENTAPEEDLSDLKDFDESVLRISVPVMNMNESKLSAFLNEVEQHIEMEFSDLDIELTGSTIMNNTQNYYINVGMFKSFGIAILVISLCILFLFSSVTHGLVALIPSVMPILLTGTIVSLIGISLDLGSMIVGAMAMGIAVDDSIHVMSRYRLLRSLGADTHRAISEALASSGKAVMLTSLILIFGFGIMVFGNFMPYIYTGTFSAMIIFFALIADLFFLPSLLYIVDKKHNSQGSASFNSGESHHAV